MRSCATKESLVRRVSSTLNAVVVYSDVWQESVVHPGWLDQPDIVSLCRSKTTYRMKVPEGGARRTTGEEVKYEFVSPTDMLDLGIEIWGRTGKYTRRCNGIVLSGRDAILFFERVFSMRKKHLSALGCSLGKADPAEMAGRRCRKAAKRAYSVLEKNMSGPMMQLLVQPLPGAYSRIFEPRIDILICKICAIEGDGDFSWERLGGMLSWADLRYDATHSDKVYPRKVVECIEETVALSAELFHDAMPVPYKNDVKSATQRVAYMIVQALTATNAPELWDVRYGDMLNMCFEGHLTSRLPMEKKSSAKESDEKDEEC